MTVSKPKCGHSTLKSTCDDCERFKQKWYRKVEDKDPDWRDIEYGLENPDRLYEAVNTLYGIEDPDQVIPSQVDPITTEYYDRILAIFHRWVAQGRSKRDCLIAELLGSQEGNSGTERGIAAALKSKRLKPNSRSAVHQTIQEIKALVLKINQPHQGVEQSSPALYPLDSKPHKDEANGKTAQELSKPKIERSNSRNAA